MPTLKQVRELVESKLLDHSLVSAWLGYGEPLFLSFTKSEKVCKDRQNNSSTQSSLHTNFATWSIKGPIEANSESDLRDHLVVAVQSLIGGVVHEVEVAPDGVLAIRFDRSRGVTVAPWPEEDGLSDAWCMTLPDDKILAVSNAGQVVIVDQHVPIRDWFVDGAG